MEAPKDKSDAATAEASIAALEAIDATILRLSLAFPLCALFKNNRTSASSSSNLKAPRSAVRKLPMATLPRCANR